MFDEHSICLLVVTWELSTPRQAAARANHGTELGDLVIGKYHQHKKSTEIGTAVLPWIAEQAEKKFPNCVSETLSNAMHAALHDILT